MELKLESLLGPITGCRALYLLIPQMYRGTLEDNQLIHEQRIAIQKGFRQLVADVPHLAQSEGYYRLFNEFVNEGEFGLALDAVLDYLGENPSLSVPQSAIQTLEWLHAAMGLEPLRLTALKER
jgi:hypothetical protein